MDVQVLWLHTVRLNPHLCSEPLLLVLLSHWRSKKHTKQNVETGLTSVSVSPYHIPIEFETIFQVTEWPMVFIPFFVPLVSEVSHYPLVVFTLSISFSWGYKRKFEVCLWPRVWHWLVSWCITYPFLPLVECRY